jgi:hypothetical protein
MSRRATLLLVVALIVAAALLIAFLGGVGVHSAAPSHP